MAGSSFILCDKITVFTIKRTFEAVVSYSKPEVLEEFFEVTTRIILGEDVFHTRVAHLRVMHFDA